MIRFIARTPMYLWVSLCLAMTILVLVLYDWSAERAAWLYMDARGFPTWAILSGFVIAWLRNSIFWTWLILVGLGSGWFSYQVKKIQPRNETKEAQPIS
jgi:hypothetical protein